MSSEQAYAAARRASHAAEVTSWELTDMDDRLVYVRELQILLREVQDAIVAEARTEGLSWRQIGQALMLSKQGAQQRYRDYSP